MNRSTHCKQIIPVLLLICTYCFISCDTTNTTSTDNASLSSAITTTCNGSLVGTLENKVLSTPLPNYCGETVTVGTTITFSAPTVEALEIQTKDENGTISLWEQGTTVTFTTPGTTTVSVRTINETASEKYYTRNYTVLDHYPRDPDDSSTDAISHNDRSILFWADKHSEYIVGTDCDVTWQTPEKSYGAAEGDSYNIVCLGNGGSITLTFPGYISNEEGADFAIFENSFSDDYLELAYVEVSSNGKDFVRFSTHSKTDAPVGGYGVIDPQSIYGFAGRYRQQYGTPFDLSDLSYHYAVTHGLVNLAKITHLRIVDIESGDSAESIIEHDSFGTPVYDPYPTYGSAGFDLDGVAVIHGTCQ